MARALLLLSEYEERRIRRQNSARLRRNFRDQADALEQLSDEAFRAHFRLSKVLFQDLCSELRPLLPRAKRSTKISTECMVLTALSFYATGSYQKPIGMSFLHTLCQASVSNVVKEVTNALNHISILRKHIYFPQNRQERIAIVNKFSNRFGFPGVLGCIDGTHVAMVKPTDHEERFFNRKLYHSRNVQLICDSDLYILNIDATFGGASHDAYIWRNSEINHHMQQLYQDGEHIWLLGDSGYPLRPWLLTPIVNAEAGSAEENYTNLHCHTRNTVERCIGVLKARWRCLLAHRVLHYNHHVVAKLINACCVLHNIAIRHRLPVPEFPEEDVSQDAARQINDDRPDLHRTDSSRQLEDGRRERNILVQRLWRNQH